MEEGKRIKEAIPKVSPLLKAVIIPEIAPSFELNTENTIFIPQIILSLRM